VEKRDLSERDICTKLITPAILQAGWKQEQFREEVKLTPGRVVVRGKVAQRVKDPEAQGGPKRSDYVLYAKPNTLLINRPGPYADQVGAFPNAAQRIQHHPRHRGRERPPLPC